MLKYMEDYIIRKKNSSKKSYDYYTVKKGVNGSKIIDKKLIDQISHIYIPPAYNDVKIYLKRDLLATGIDNAGRKQYVYSDNMKKKREVKKLNQLLKLSKSILNVKKKIEKDLKLKEFTKNKLIALVLRIMDLCNFRSGNKNNEKKYGSHGLTTLHRKHITFRQNEVEIDFIGKKGVENNCVLKNKEIQEILKKVYNLSSKEDTYLFSIKNENKDHISITMNDLNEYLEQYDITTKDLRTWNANIIFLKNMQRLDLIKEFIQDRKYYEKTEIGKLNIRKKLIREAIKKTAISLHHTPTVCRNSYIFKKILNELENNERMFTMIINNKISPEDFLKSNLEK
jgi:DNA topoisomerase-1